MKEYLVDLSGLRMTRLMHVDPSAAFAVAQNLCVLSRQVEMEEGVKSGEVCGGVAIETISAE
jgi:hypothetical protein